jgi:hypothetical protein
VVINISEEHAASLMMEVPPKHHKLPKALQGIIAQKTAI